MTPTDDIDDPSWNDIFDRDKRIKELNSLLDDVRAALQWGSNESIWPPGLTPGEAIVRLVDRIDDAKIAISNAPCEIACDGECTYECRHDKLCRVCKWRTMTQRALREHEDWRPGQAE